MFQTNTSYLIPRFGKIEAEKKVVFFFPYFRELGATFIITTKLGVFLTVSDYPQPKRHARKKIFLWHTVCLTILRFLFYYRF